LRFPNFVIDNGAIGKGTYGIIFESDKPSYIPYDLGLLPLDEEKPLPSPGYWDNFKMNMGRFWRFITGQ
jgi:hypothetical protein